jgi:hypothetical protein
VLAGPRSFSQLAASFFAVESQGILPCALLGFTRYSLWKNLLAEALPSFSPSMSKNFTQPAAQRIPSLAALTELAPVNLLFTACFDGSPAALFTPSRSGLSTPSGGE